MELYSASIRDFEKKLDSIQLSDLGKEALKILVIKANGEKIDQVIEGKYKEATGVLILSSYHFAFYGISEGQKSAYLSIPLNTILNILLVEKGDSKSGDIKILTQTTEYIITGCNIEQCQLFIERAEQVIEQDYDFYFSLDSDK